MKSLKILTILFLCSFIVLPLFSQENEEINRDVKPLSEEIVEKNGVSGDIPLSEEEKNQGILPGAGDVKTADPKADKVDVDKKEPVKPRILKKRAVEEKNIQEKKAEEPVFLRIDEGNFKYSRIPELAVSEVKAPVKTADPDIENPDNSGSKSLPAIDEDGGFLGMEKGTADIVAKGGILLLILVVFILYKSRTKGTGKRGPGRNVLNSYRK